MYTITYILEHFQHQRLQIIKAKQICQFGKHSVLSIIVTFRHYVYMIVMAQ